MGLFSSSPNHTDREEKLFNLMFDSSNDGRRRDTIDKLARTKNADAALERLAYGHKESWVRREAVDKLEYARGKEELKQLVFDLSDKQLRMECLEALDSLNAESELAEIARYEDSRIGDKASRLMSIR